MKTMGLVTICCAYLLLVGVTCHGKSIHGSPEEDSSLLDRITSSEEDRLTLHVALQKLMQTLWKNFEQAMKKKGRTSSDEASLEYIVRPEDPEKNEGTKEKDATRKLQRRSLLSAIEERDSEDQHSGGKQDAAEKNLLRQILELPFKRFEHRQTQNNSLLFDPQRLFNMLLKKGPLDIFGLPGHPLRKMIEMFRQNGNKKQDSNGEDQPGENQLIRKVFEHGRDLLLDNMQKA